MQINTKLFIVLCVASIFIIPAILNRSPSPDNAEAIQRDREASDAFVMAQTFVLKELKAPATAKFPNQRECAQISQRLDGQWDVNCYVDAQNSFGAMLRTNFEITLRRKGDRWTQVYLTIK